MAAPLQTAQSFEQRRYDLDWVRIGAFLLLILYHIGMYYVTWDWHVKSPHASPAVEPLMLLTSPWRLSLLFLVAYQGFCRDGDCLITCAAIAPREAPSV